MIQSELIDRIACDIRDVKNVNDINFLSGELREHRKYLGRIIGNTLQKGDKVIVSNGSTNDEGIITESKFKTFGCGSAIASSSLATEWVKGKSVDEASMIQNTEIVNELSLPPVKIHCSVLAEDAIKGAIKDYKQKNEIKC